jgi:Endosomal/lysosomal potassium channel TMEM175
LGPLRFRRLLSEKRCCNRPSYVALVTSFFTILLMWVHHHAILRNVCRTDAWLHFANGCLLLGVTFYLFIRAAFRKPLLSPSASDVFIAKTCHDYMFGPPPYLLATISALLDARVSLLICTALWIFWATTITKNTRA